MESCSESDFNACYMQVFHYDSKKFWIMSEAGHLTFYTPEEY